MRSRFEVLVIVVILVLPVNPLLASAQPLELAYDDGGFDYGWSNFYPIGAAVRFSAPSQNWGVQEIRFHGICYLRPSILGYFLIEICDTNFNFLYRKFLSFQTFFEGKNATLDWYTVKVPDILVSGDFYVLIAPALTLDGPQLWISVDSDVPISNRSLAVDTSRHIVIESYDATSKKPLNFMIRVEGQPVTLAPELKLTSIEINEEATVITYNLLGTKAKEIQAQLFSTNGSVIEGGCSVTPINNASFRVIVRSQGMLGISVSTDCGTISAGLTIGDKLRTSYGNLVREVQRLRNEIATMSYDLETAMNENALLNGKLNETDALLLGVSDRITRMASDIVRLSHQNKSLNEENTELADQNRLLLSGLVIAIVAVLVFVIVRKEWKR